MAEKITFAYDEQFKKIMERFRISCKYVESHLNSL